MCALQSLRPGPAGWFGCRRRRTGRHSSGSIADKPAIRADVHHARVDDQRVGAAFRAVRLKRRLRQTDVAAKAGVSRGLVSLIERGHLDRVALAGLRRVAAALEIRIDVTARWRGGELYRSLDADHASLQDSVVGYFGGLPGWMVVPEASFAVFGERGSIDVLCWHAATRSLLVIELKTQIVDIQDLIGSVDRKRRLAREVARHRGWHPVAVSCWVIVSESRTNRRRAAAHASVLRSAFPAAGSDMRMWLAAPGQAIAAMSFWTDATRRSVIRPIVSPKRVRAARQGRGAPSPSTEVVHRAAAAAR
jgi:transcriptional regulator with XRE-family HTH domain